MKDFLERLLRRPTVAHGLAAQHRFSRRLGPQFAGAVTYYSVLSMVPIIMFAVAALGMTLTVLRPDWLQSVGEFLTRELGDTELSRDIRQLVMDALFNWRGITVVALLTAAYAGTRWVGNLKKALRVMWRDRFADAAPTGNFFLELLGNLIIFLGLLISVLLAMVVTTAGGALSQNLIAFLGWGHVPGIRWLVRLTSLLLSFVASWLLFAFLLTVLPGKPTRIKTWLQATIAGAIAVVALQQVGGLLIGAFSGTLAGSVFGPIIVVMLMFNVLATIILLVSAWVGTATTWPKWLEDRLREIATRTGSVEPVSEVEVEGEPATVDAAEVQADDPRSWAEKRRRERWAARLSPDELRASSWHSAPDTEDAPPVPQEIAARGVRVGLGVGWGVGAATGVGLGAAVAALVSRAARR